MNHSTLLNASECLPFIFEPDLGNFLLYSFSRRRSEIQPVISALNSYQSQQWSALSGIIRALIWLGLKKYIEANHEVFSEVQEKIGRRGWWGFVKLDVANANSDAIEKFQATLDSLASEDERRARIDLRERQTDKDDIFIPVRDWLKSLTRLPDYPTSDLEWKNLTDALFWLGHLEQTDQTRIFLRNIDLDAPVETLSIELLASLSLGLYYVDSEIHQSWLKKNYSALINQFRKETQTVIWEDDGEIVKSGFLLDFFNEGSRLHSESEDKKEYSRRMCNASMYRIALLRNLFPHYSRYDSQGHGHLLGDNDNSPDDTFKHIPIANLPLHYLVSLNASFKALVDFEYRPDTWEDYTNFVFHTRQQIVKVFRQLIIGLIQYFRKENKTRILGDDIDSELWMDCESRLKYFPFLPQCSVDEWGYSSEQMESGNDSQLDQIEKHFLAVQKYKSYSKKSGNHYSLLRDFFDQAGLILNFHPHVRDEDKVYSDLESLAQQALGLNLQYKARQSVIALGDLLKSLKDFQVKSRSILGRFIEKDDLKKLEADEIDVFDHLWYLWYFFAFKPGKRFISPERDVQKEFTKKVMEIQRSIKVQLKEANNSFLFENLKVTLISSDIEWDNETTLWIKIDGESAIEVYSAVELLFTHVQLGVQNVHKNELRRHAIDLTWKNIAILPCMNGKLIDNRAWKLPSLFVSVPGTELTNQHYTLCAISEETLYALGLSAWQHPCIQSAQELTGTTSELSYLLSHIQCFKEILENADDQGFAIFIEYFENFLFKELGDNLGKFNECRESLMDSVNTHFKEDERLQNLAEDRLSHLCSLIVPGENFYSHSDNKIHIDMQVVSDWADQLVEARFDIGIIHLSLVEDIVKAVVHEY